MTALAGGAAAMIVGCGTTHAAQTASSGGPGGTSSGSGTAGRVPAAAQVVTVQALHGPIVGAKVPAPFTVTDRVEVRRIASVVDRLPRMPAGRFGCPANFGKQVELVFRSKAGGPALATATANVGGCQSVVFAANGAPRASLSGGAAAVRQILAIAGQHWTGYGGFNNGIPVHG